MPHNLDMTALRAFATVAEAGGVTKAAGLLNLTQSAVSMQIKRLEDFLGQTLFLRQSRKLALSPEAVSPTCRAERSSSCVSSISSSRLICIDTADCVRFRNPAARVTPPASAIATKERNEVKWRFRDISQSLMREVKSIHFHNVFDSGMKIKWCDAPMGTHHRRR